jgi:hypothetical protein
LSDDSFYWGWGINRGSTSFFKTTAHIRGFFYNADSDGARTVRNIAGRTWPILALRSDYIATAGSMKADDAKEFLRPTPLWIHYIEERRCEAFLYATISR